MRMRWFGGCFLVMALSLAGCRSKVAMTLPEVAPEDTTTHLGEGIGISLADWLKLPRPELAKMVEEWTATVQKQRESSRASVATHLLPQLHAPVLDVVFAEAKFSPAAGFSLPPYLKEGQKDAAVALHLARFGDREAAVKLADDDKERLAQIDACHTERNYPVEWTRLVGLVLQNAQLKLVGGDADGATELVQLHRQLRSVLDAKAALCPLGAALLPRGRQALTLAAAAWREPRWNKTALSNDIDIALADWGAMPDPIAGLAVGVATGGSPVSFFFGPQASRLWPRGRAVIASTPPQVQRALDLLALPLSAEGVSDVVAFLDDKHTLTEVLVVYRPKINELFPQPQNLALALVEHGYTSQTPAAGPGLNRQTWTGGGLSYEVSLLTRGNAGGALIRVAKAGAPAPVASFAQNPRDFGAVNLDRSFEQDRLEVAPEQSGPALEITDKDKLARITQPATAFALSAALLKRETSVDLLAQLTLRWPADQNANALSRLVLPLWAAYGPARIEGVETPKGDQLVLTWEDSNTRLKLHLPYDDKGPELLAEDSRGPSALKARAEAAEQLARRERLERLAAGKPRTRLARFVQLPSHGIDNLRLGMTREEAKAIVPGSQSIRIQPLADGLNILFRNEPPTTATYWPRQMFVRFGADDCVAEIRVRYQEGPHAPSKTEPSLLDTLKKNPNGAPETLPATWAGLWTDLPTRKQPIQYRWLDDATSWTYQHDKGGSEVVLRDCPAEQPLGVHLPPLEFCRRGVDACVLGDTRSEVRKRWQITKPLLASNGAEVMVLPTKSPYDVLLVWYTNDKVSRLIARHRTPKTVKPQEIGAALQQAWAADFDRLGYLRRQDGPLGQVVQSYSWNDDRTRVRIFAQETEEGVRLFTEWREWPIPAKTLAAK